MSLKLKSIIALIVVVVLAFWLFNRDEGSTGGVTRGGEYFATTTIGMGDTFNQIVFNRPTTLGSIIIASSSATAFRVWNATSSTDTASTTIAEFVASAPEGEYTFDAVLTRGLNVERISGFNGNFTATYRPQ
jgi:hypothetical protein